MCSAGRMKSRSLTSTGPTTVWTVLPMFRLLPPWVSPPAPYHRPLGRYSCLPVGLGAETIVRCAESLDVGQVVGGVGLNHLHGVLVVDPSLVVDPVDVDAELPVPFPVVLEQVAGRRLAHDDVAGRRPEGPSDLVFLQRAEPIRGMRVDPFRRMDRAGEPSASIVRVERLDALGVVGSVQALDVLNPCLRIRHSHEPFPSPPEYRSSLREDRLTRLQGGTYRVSPGTGRPRWRKADPESAE